MQSYGQWHSAVFGGSLFQTAYRADASVNAFGAQAFFDLESENDPAEGLRITFNRSEFIGPAGDGVVVTVRDTTSNTVDYDADARTLDITVTNTNQNLSAIKTIIDALTDTPFATDYLPSTATTDDVEVPQDGVFGGGTKDDIRTVVVTAESDVRVAIASGGTAPADAATDGVTLVVAEYPRAFRLPAGHTLWVRSQTGSHDGSIEVYGLL